MLPRVVERGYVGLPIIGNSRSVGVIGETQEALTLFDDVKIERAFVKTAYQGLDKVRVATVTNGQRSDEDYLEQTKIAIDRHENMVRQIADISLMDDRGCERQIDIFVDGVLPCEISITGVDWGLA